MKAYTLEEKRKIYANAYKPWTDSEEELLVELFESGKTVTEITEHLKRNNGAIISRLNKLGYEINLNEIMDYNKLGYWAKGYLDAILEGDKVSKSQIKMLIDKLEEAIKEDSKVQQIKAPPRNDEFLKEDETDDLPF